MQEGDARLDPVRLSNPMSVEQSVMRTMLLPGLLQAVRENVDRLNDPPSIFEIGKVYLWDEPVPAPEHAAEPGAVLPHEPEIVAVVMTGRLQPEAWTGPARTTDFYTLKGVVERTLAAVGLAAEYAPVGDDARYPFLHPGKTALVRLPGVGEIGVLGQLRADVAAAFGLDDLEVYVAGLSADFVPAALRSRAVHRPRPVPAGRTGPRRGRRPGRAGGGGGRRRPPGPAASSCRACACSTCTRATRCRRTSARWPCAS